MTCLFLSSIPGDSAVITSLFEVATLPVTNLQTVQPSRVFRSLTNSAQLTIHLASSLACNAVAIVAHNGLSDATWRLTGASVEANLFTTPTVDSGTLSMWPASGKPNAEQSAGFPYLSSLLVINNASALSWWGVTILDTSNADDFEAGRLMIGKAIRPTINVSNDFGIQPISKGEARRSDFNEITTDDRGVNSRRMVLPFKAIDRVDFRNYILPFQMQHGVSKDFYFSLDPTAQEDFLMYSMQSLFEDTSLFQRQLMSKSTGRVFSTGMSLIEVT